MDKEMAAGTGLVQVYWNRMRKMRVPTGPDEMRAPPLLCWSGYPAAADGVASSDEVS